mgnify:FL=1
MKQLLFIAGLVVASSFSLGSCRSERDKQQDKELEELRQLADMDRREMENQYQQFALQYDELKKGIKDDSLLSQLGREQERAKSLLEELRRVKSTDAAEIKRLKKELETVRAVLRSFVLQVDSLQRENGRLTNERDVARSQLNDANTMISSLDQERAKLNDKVAIAAQLNASGISIIPQKRSGKQAKKSKDIELFLVSFTLNRNVTAATGNKMVYVRLMNPNGSTIGGGSSFTYENRSLESSAAKSIEYNGEEQHVSLVVGASNEFLSPGKYSVHLFCDGQMIGSTAITLEK